MGGDNGWEIEIGGGLDWDDVPVSAEVLTEHGVVWFTWLAVLPNKRDE